MENENSVSIEKINDEWHTIHYSEFSVGSAEDDYPLIAGEFDNYDDVTDWFASHQFNGIKFSTPDKNNNCTDINLSVKILQKSNCHITYTEKLK